MSETIQQALRQLGELQAAIPRQADQPPITLPRAPEQPANPWDMLTRFGLAMAASRNPSLFGQFGEAGQSMQEQMRQQRRDQREENELELNRVYREAQLNLERQTRLGDPVRIALAQAQLHEAQARLDAARVQAGAAGREGNQIIGQRWTEDGRLFGIRRNGTAVEITPPEGARFANPELDVRRDQLWLNTYQRTYDSLSRNPLNINAPPEQIARQAAAAADAAIARVQGNRPAAAAPAAPPTIRIDPAGRPIQ